MAHSSKVALLLSLALCGCAKHVQVRVVVPNPCIKSIELGPQTSCEKEPNGVIRCTGLVMVKENGCEQLEVVKK